MRENDLLVRIYTKSFDKIKQYLQLNERYHKVTP